MQALELLHSNRNHSAERSTGRADPTGSSFLTKLTVTMVNSGNGVGFGSNIDLILMEGRGDSSEMVI